MLKQIFLNILLIVFLTSCIQTKKENKITKTESFAQFQEMSLNSIKPTGWLEQYLIRQKDGLTGHLEVAGYPFNEIWWGDTIRQNNTSTMKWWPYEQTGYWLDAMLKCAYQINDTELRIKATEQLDFVLNHPAKDGYLGPLFMKPSYEGDRWAHAVFFRALQGYYSATGNPKILTALRDHYLGSPFPYEDIRELMNLETILFVSKHLSDDSLKNFGFHIYDNFQQKNGNNPGTEKYFNEDKPADIHGVTYNELAKLGAIMYTFSGDSSQLNSSIQAIERIKKYHLMPDGVNISSEKMRTPANSIQGHETCDIADFSWTLSYLLMATGNPEYADMIEKAIFNAAPSVVNSSFKALQYFSSTNQVIADNHSCHTPQGKGSAAMSYRPNPYTECCPANVNRIMPNFLSRLWLKPSDKGIVAAMYAPSTVEFKTARNPKKIKINEITNYPFSDTIKFIFDLNKQEKFPFYFRIPTWCTSPSLTINGKTVDIKPTKNSYQVINRKFKMNDKIELILPQKLKSTKSVDNGIWLERGPLVYTLKIEEDWQIDSLEEKSTKDFPAYNLYAKSKWNYALSIDTSKSLEDQIEVISKPITDNPWTIHNAPLLLKVPAHEVENWTLIHKNKIQEEKWVPVANEKGQVTDWEMVGMIDKKGSYNFTPELPKPSINSAKSNSTNVTVELVPYGCSKLRLTIFPLFAN